MKIQMLFTDDELHTLFEATCDSIYCKKNYRKICVIKERARVDERLKAVMTIKENLCYAISHPKYIWE